MIGRDEDEAALGDLCESEENSDCGEQQELNMVPYWLR